MDILEAAAQLNPGTAWNLRGTVLEQADDGSPKVVVPDVNVLQALVDATPVVISLDQRISNLEVAVNQLATAKNVPVVLPTTEPPVKSVGGV